MGKRAGVLELAVLGLLQESPMHGYELRKRLNAVLGAFRAFSYGSLYPCLKDMLTRGWIAEDGPADAGAPALSGKRAKIVYRITADGKDHFQQLLSESGPQAWEDDDHFVLPVESRDTRSRDRVVFVRCSVAMHSCERAGPEFTKPITTEVLVSFLR